MEVTETLCCDDIRGLLGSPNHLWEKKGRRKASTIQWANLCLETAFPFCWLAGSPPGLGRECWEPWECIQAGVSRDNVRVGRPEHKELFTHWKCLEVPDPLDEGESNQERCLNRQIFKLNWFQRLKGIPLKSSQDDREIPGGHKGWPRRI